ncbi:MAG: exo-alpha-sialidase [Chloroflexi bacterium]|nr:exo-alpha-sialidase [Chloroflexota bacterium]
MTDRILLLVGTKKGAFILRSDGDRRAWTIDGPMCEGWPIQDISADPATGTLYAGGGSPWYGPTVFRSDDLGASWTQSSDGLTYGDAGPKITAVWNVTAAHGSLFAGVGPAGLFRSEDGGRSWAHVEGLTNHPTRSTWQPGAGGLICHTIVPHPTDPARMWIAISAVGTFETRDGGASWEPRNEGVRADFMPDPRPVTGQCVHKLVMAAGEPERLYQQNHCGVYRSLDGGLHWAEITAGLPSEFGFAMTAHPRDPLTVWAIPLNGADRGRYMPDGAAAVWRTIDGGDTWLRGDAGLPQRDAYLGVLREAMAHDELEPVGVYFGTSTGQLCGSADAGASWTPIATSLPPIWSVEAIRVEA